MQESRSRGSESQMASPNVSDPRPSNPAPSHPTSPCVLRSASSCSTCSVERGASPHTLKGYREDLHALAEYLADGEGAQPAAGQHHDERAARLSLGAARSGLRQDIDLAAPGVGPQLLEVRPARRLGQSEPGQGASQPAEEPQAAALSDDRRSRQAARSRPRATRRPRSAIARFWKRSTRPDCA